MAANLECIATGVGATEPAPNLRRCWADTYISTAARAQTHCARREHIILAQTRGDALTLPERSDRHTPALPHSDGEKLQRIDAAPFQYALGSGILPHVAAASDTLFAERRARSLDVYKCAGCTEVTVLSG